MSQIVCGLVHILVGLYTLGCVRGELVDSLVKRPEQLFGCVSHFFGVIGSIAFCRTFFAKDKSSVLKNAFFNKSDNGVQFPLPLADL